MTDSSTDTENPPPPRRNPHLLGHEAAERQFLAAWQAGRVPHAWLVAGPPGIGKATLAYRIARFALAGGGGDAASGAGLFGDVSPSPELEIGTDHPVFKRVASGGHADLMTLERPFAGTDDEKKDPRERKRKTVIGIEEVRDAGAFLRLTPAEKGWRVMVVDTADEMNQNAANGILKLLEEPPRKSLILLISHSPGRLLPTIRSRCCALRLEPLSDDTVATLIGRYRPDIEAADAAGLVRLAEGSIGRALALAEEGALDLYRDIVALMAQLPRPETAGLHAFGDRLGRPGAEDTFRTAGALIAWWVGRMIRDGAAGRTSAPVVAEEAGCAARLFAASGVDRWLAVWEKITRLMDQTDRLHLDRKQVVLNVFAELGSAARA